MKREILELYNKRLDERIKRKSFIIDHGLLDLERQAWLDKQSKECKFVRKKLVQFERFHSREEHDELIETIMKIKNLKRRIKNLEELQEYARFEDIEVLLYYSRNTCWVRGECLVKFDPRRV